jgi:hypothetical protein
MHELISNRGASGEIWTARRARNAEVSGDESGWALSWLTRGVRVRPGSWTDESDAVIRTEPMQTEPRGQFSTAERFDSPSAGMNH